MGQLIITHTTFHIATTPLAFAIFLGLAIHVITCNPRRPITWVFSILCLAVAGIYLSDLFLTLPPPATLSLYHLLTHWKGVAVVLSSILYLHLAFFYFLPTWQRFRLWILAPLYLFSAGLIPINLFTDLPLDGHLDHSTPGLVGLRPGLFFIIFYAGFFTLAMIGSAAGLLISYYSTPSPSFRQQIVHLLMTTGLILLGGGVHWITVFTGTTHQSAHLLPDMLLVFAAILYGRAVVHYGSFVGRPLARRDLVYSTLATIAGLAALYLTITLDQWLINHTPLPYYLVTGIFVLTVATGFPAISRWITDELDRRLFQTEYQQQRLARYLAEALIEAHHSAHLPAEMLNALRVVLDVANGYIALTSPNLPADKLAVQLVQGSLSLQPGDLIRRPPVHGKEPQLAAALLPQPPAEPGWQEIALFCPLTTAEGLEGILALGEKRDKTPFHLPELLFCAEFIKQLNAFRRTIQLSQHLQAPQAQEQILRQPGKATTLFSSQTLPARESPSIPLEIRVLGPLQVTRQGRAVCEAEWGSEKAKGLLAYLLWKSPMGVTREELCATLWPNRAVDETANVFHVTLHRLRRVLQVESGRQAKGVSYIQHDRGRYRFNLEAPHWLDLTAFQALVASDNPARLQAAIKLYRGSYMEDLAWALPVEVEAERRRLEQLYTDALRRLAAQAGEREALYYLEKLLVIEPADEIAHRALALGYLARGRGDLAWQQVRRWQQALSEFDLEASLEAKFFWQLVEAKNKHPL